MSLTASPTKRQQIIDEITEGIMRGSLHTGTRLTSVRNMASRFDVSISVVQNALKTLIENGFIECRGAGGFFVRDNPAAVGKNAKETVRKSGGKMFLSCMHHSDLVWRRTYAEYTKIRDAQIKHMLKLMDKYKQLHILFEQAEMVKVYLGENPADYVKMKQFFTEGRIEFSGGMCIPDLNMVSGESIVRNLQMGRQYYNELFDCKPVVACMNDAFGMCAQLPQILIKNGYSALLPGRMPNVPSEMPANVPFRWYGADNTSITVGDAAGSLSGQGYTFNVPVIYNETRQLARSVAALKYLEGDVFVKYITEEGLVEEDLFWIIESVNKTPGRNIEFGRVEDYFNLIAAHEMPSCYGEFNPVFTGCYTTRIGIKQQIRKAENLLFAAEFIDAAAGRGKKVDSDPLWHELILTQFHDAICGCHTDKAYDEIAAKLEYVNSNAGKIFGASSENEFGICNFNNIPGMQLIETDKVPEGVEAQKDSDKFYFIAELPPCGVRNFKKSASSATVASKCGRRFRTDYFDVDFSGVEPVIRNLEGANVFGRDGFGEIQIRSDFGTMWTEKFMHVGRGKEFQEEAVIESVEGPVFFKVVTEGNFTDGEAALGNVGIHWPGFESLRFRKEYIFPKHLDYFKLKLSIEWKGCATKVSICFPLDLNVADSVGTYETPFGSIVRKPYFEVSHENESTFKALASQSDYSRACGDWPTLNWVNYSDMRKGLTLANTGTPGHQLVNGSILVSLIRSGTGIQDGCMVPQVGSYDNGLHEYEFAFRAHHPREMEKAYELGILLNRAPEVFEKMVIRGGSLLKWDAANIALSAVRRLDGDTVLVRLYETLGREAHTTFEGALLQKTFNECDIDGGNMKPASPEHVSFSPFEIKTFLFTKSST